MIGACAGVAGIAVALVCLLARSAAADGLSDDEVAKKNTGGYFTGLPLVNYTTDTGLGYGARVYYYFDGDRDDPRFKSTPYLYRVFLQGFASTRGLQFHWLDFDAPKIGDTPYRIRSQLIYERNINQNYFGQGNAALRPLQFAGSPMTFKTFDATARPSSRSRTARPTASTTSTTCCGRSSSRASSAFFSDRIRVLGGVGFSYAKIRDYSGQQVDAVDGSGGSTTATEAQTRLKTDCMAGLLVGCDGGRDDFLRERKKCKGGAALKRGKKSLPIVRYARFRRPTEGVSTDLVTRTDRSEAIPV